MNAAARGGAWRNGASALIKVLVVLIVAVVFFAAGYMLAVYLI